MIDKELLDELVKACKTEPDKDNHIVVPYTIHGYKEGSFAYWANAEYFKKQYGLNTDFDESLDNEWVAIDIEHTSEEDAKAIIQDIRKIEATGCIDPDREKTLREETFDDFLEDEFNDIWKSAKAILEEDKELRNQIKEDHCWFSMSRNIKLQIRTRLRKYAIVMYASRESHNESVAESSLTVAELMEELADKGRNLPVLVASDDGYTYCSLTPDSFSERGDYCHIRVSRDCHSIGNCIASEKAGDIIDCLADMPSGLHVVFNHDNGFTFGSVTPECIRLKPYYDTGEFEESMKSTKARLTEDVMDFDSLVEEMKDAVKSHNAGKAHQLYRQADRMGYYLSTNWAMSGFEAGVYNDEGFVDDLVLYIPTEEGWDFYEGDRKNWPEPYCGFMQIRNDDHVKMKESGRFHESEELKSYRAIKGMLPKFLKKFLAVFDEVYNELYDNGEVGEEEAIVMFDKLLKDHVWNLFIGMCASQRGDIFSSDREACAFVMAVQRFFGDINI